MKSLFSWFRTIAFWEGVSYVLILINMIVVKRINPELGADLVYPIGMAHGVLFIAYLVMAVLVLKQYNKNIVWLLIAGIASIIPFGTFYMEGKWRKQEAEYLSKNLR